jgi:hypothetical protein
LQECRETLDCTLMARSIIPSREHTALNAFASIANYQQPKYRNPARTSIEAARKQRPQAAIAASALALTAPDEPPASIDLSITGERNPQQALTGYQRQMCMAVSW